MKLETIAAPMVNLALTEDLGSGDVTTEGIVPEGTMATGKIYAREDGVLAGLDVARIAFACADPSVDFTPVLNDGAVLKPDAEICAVAGPATGILAAERVALNFLQRLSGVASATRRFVEAVSGTDTTILDTRKTTPGLRILEKYAVSVGGGGNHRFGLFDMYLIKDNHLKVASGIREAVRRVKERKTDLPIEVEVTTINEVREACDAGVNRIMLDNMSIEDTKASCEIVKAIPEGAGRPEIESSGGINLDNVRDVAMCGVDFISVGGITHSAPAIDMSLELDA